MSNGTFTESLDASLISDYNLKYEIRLLAK